MSLHPVRLSLLAALLAFAGCNSGLFNEKNYLTRPITEAELKEIRAIELSEQSKTAPVTVDEASANIVRDIVDPPPPPETIELTLAEVRAAALQNNLDLAVEIYNPEIAGLDVDVERARFESAFTASARRGVIDSPTALGTEGSQSTFDDFDLGVNIPLRTGGTARVNLPFSRTETNNPFSLLNPAHESDLRFSLSQPILRNAGVNTNTHFIRIAEYQEQATTARTKLEAIRILADADRAYWGPVRSAGRA